MKQKTIRNFFAFFSILLSHSALLVHLKADSPHLSPLNVNAIFPSLLDKNVYQVSEEKSEYNRLDLSGLNFRFGDLTSIPLDNLQIFDLSYTNISAKQLYQLLKAFPRIKSLNLYECKGLGACFLALTPKCLNNLEYINLSGCDFWIMEFKKLFNAAPCLKRLELKMDSSWDSFLFFLAPNIMPNLEYISFSLSQPIEYYGTLDILFKSAPSLKELDLFGVSCASLHINLEADSLSHLEKINLGFCDLSLNNFFILMKASPYLKTLDLSCNKGLNLFFSSLKPLKLKRLESINLSSCYLSSSEVISLLKAAPHLKDLDLSEQRDLDLIFHPFQELFLPQLEKLSLNSCGISKSLLASIFRIAPNLKELSLNGCQGLNQVFDKLFVGGVTKLESVHLVNSDIESIGFNKLIDIAPHLKQIDLNGCIYIKDLLINESVVTNLQEIWLMDANLSSEDIYRLSKMSPHLKNLYLGDHEDLDGLFNDLPDNSLNQLQKLSLISSKLSSQTLKRLSKVAPNLKDLDLTSCLNIEACFNEAESYSLDQLEVLHITNTEIAIKKPVFLKKFAPNLNHLNFRKLTKAYRVFDLVKLEKSTQDLYFVWGLLHLGVKSSALNDALLKNKGALYSLLNSIKYKE
ncbi:MAG: hypothetical protein ACOVOR_02480 [Rhabdochlamydiaceae bacterium]